MIDHLEAECVPLQSFVSNAKRGIEDKAKTGVISAGLINCLFGGTPSDPVTHRNFDIECSSNSDLIVGTVPLFGPTCFSMKQGSGALGTDCMRLSVAPALLPGYVAAIINAKMTMFHLAQDLPVSIFDKASIPLAAYTQLPIPKIDEDKQRGIHWFFSFYQRARLYEVSRQYGEFIEQVLNACVGNAYFPHSTQALNADVLSAIEKVCLKEFPNAMAGDACSHKEFNGVMKLVDRWLHTNDEISAKTRIFASCIDAQTGLAIYEAADRFGSIFRERSRPQNSIATGMQP